MAYSTQKNFMRIDPLSRTRKELQDKGQLDAGINTYLSCTDERAWSLDPDERAQFLSDMIACSPIINYDEDKKSEDTEKIMNYSKSKSQLHPEAILHSGENSSESGSSHPYNSNESTLAALLEHEKERHQTSVEEAPFNICTCPLVIRNVASEGAIARRAKIVRARNKLLPNFHKIPYMCGKAENMLKIAKARGEITTKAVTELLDQYLRKVEQFACMCKMQQQAKLMKQGLKLANFSLDKIEKPESNLTYERKQKLKLKLSCADKHATPSSSIRLSSSEHCLSDRTIEIPRVPKAPIIHQANNQQKWQPDRKYSDSESHRLTLPKNSQIIRFKSPNTLSSGHYSKNATMGGGERPNQTVGPTRSQVSLFQTQHCIDNRNYNVVSAISSLTNFISATNTRQEYESDTRRENSDLFFHKPDSIFSFQRGTRAINMVRKQTDFVRNLEQYTNQLNGAVGSLMRIMEELSELKGIVTRAINAEGPVPLSHQPSSMAGPLRRRPHSMNEKIHSVPSIYSGRSSDNSYSSQNF